MSSQSPQWPNASAKGSNISKNQAGIGSLLAFVFSRILREGPRMLLYLAVGSTFMLVVMMSAPDVLPYLDSESTSSDIALASWAWLPAPSQGKVDGGLRIVVFGGDDIATPSSQYQGAGLASWTQELCQQLSCSTYLSMVPRVNGTVHSITSNSMYASAVENAIGQFEMQSRKPGYDYAFVAEQYPVPRAVPDLTQQIDQFLAMQQGPMAPVDTLWVLSLGMWDIWSLAAIPFEISEELVEDLADHVFDQVERLYRGAMNSSSIAWSSGQQITETAKSKGNDTASAAITPASFRILIPQVMDPSLAPGWGNNRPSPPGVHSKAEQMRNAARLTEKWNYEMTTGLEAWMTLSEDTKLDIVASGLDTQGTPDDASKDTAALHNAIEQEEYPVRKGLLFDLQESILEALVDRQIRESALVTVEELEMGPSKPIFANVGQPCLDTSTVKQRENTDEDEDKLETDPAVHAREVRRRPIVSRFRGTASAVRRKAEQSACANPDDYLFATPFAVSRRVSIEIAQEVASMVRLGKSRAIWEEHPSLILGLE